jgi:hypothetical protein
MTVRAISIIEPVIGPICRGDLCVLWRAGAQVEGLAVGDLLWVREPFYLPREFNRFSPTVARDRGAKVRFAVDLLTAPGPKGYLGTRRMARTCPGRGTVSICASPASNIASSSPSQNPRPRHRATPAVPPLRAAGTRT